MASQLGGGIMAVRRGQGLSAAVSRPSRSRLRRIEMGPTRSRLTAGLIAIVVASAGAGVLALAQDNAPKAQDQAVPAAAKAAPAKTEATPTKETEKDKEKEKESPSTATTQSTTPPAGGHTVKKGKLSFKVQGDGVFVAAQPFELRLKMNSHSGSLKIVSAAPTAARSAKATPCWRSTPSRSTTRSPPRRTTSPPPRRPWPRPSRTCSSASCLTPWRCAWPSRTSRTPRPM